MFPSVETTSSTFSPFPRFYSSVLCLNGTWGVFCLIVLSVVLIPHSFSVTFFTLWLSPFFILFQKTHIVLQNYTSQHDHDHQFHFLRAAFSSHLKNRVDLTLTKTLELRVNLNIDGEFITSKSHTHPSHSQTPRLLTSSLSLGVPVHRQVSVSKSSLKTHEVADCIPCSVIYGPVGSTKKCLKKSVLPLGDQPRFYPYLRSIVPSVLWDRTPFLKKRSIDQEWICSRPGGESKVWKREKILKIIIIRDSHKLTIHIEDDEHSTGRPPLRYDGPFTLSSLGGPEDTDRYAFL